MKIHFVVGPTASGKSSYAIDLAKQIGGEIVCADSVQVFREFNIGSAKVTPEEAGGVPHHMLDILEPEARYTAGDYRRDALDCILDIAKRQLSLGIIDSLDEPKIIVCGGTGLYINSLLYEPDDLPPADDELRERLGGLEAEELVELAKSEGMTLEGIDMGNPRRLIRAIEIFKATGEELGSFRELKRTDIMPIFHFMEHSREELYECIEIRTVQMIEAGLVSEVEGIVKRHGEDLQALGAIGYRQALMHLRGELTLDEMRSDIAQKTRNYAKRQITWFKKYKVF